MRKNLSRFLRRRLFRVIGLGLIALFLVMMRPLAASSEGAVAPLPPNCKADPLKYAGIRHCVLDGEKNTHVILIDLQTANLRFETALSGIYESGKFVRECTDVNVPQWAIPGRGCINGGVYPFETVQQIAVRNPGVSVAINADYFGSDDHMHGAEGLTIKNGQRFDGWELGDCDGDGKLNRDGKTQFDHRTPAPCNGNDVNRPSLTISRSNRVEIGYRTPEEVDNKSLYADRFYNAVGGGPLIVRQGVAQSNTACGNDPGLPQGRVCDPQSQSAVALSGDGRTLLFAIADRNANEMGKLFTDTFRDYSIQTALKLDGGGSPQLYYGGQPYGTAISGGNRSVGEALLIFAPLALELDATVDNPTDVMLADPGQRLTLNLTFVNAGIKPWNSQNLTLVNTNNQPLGANPVQPVGGARQISPGASLPLTVMIQAPNGTGLYSSEWQLKHGDQAFGPKVTTTVIVLPPQAKELRDRIQREIDQWRKTGEQKSDELIRQIQKQIEEWLATQAQNILQELLRQLGCTKALALMTLVGFGWWLGQLKQGG